MTINVIVAVSDNGVIGKDGKIPWKLSTDLARFKEITMGSACIMGRKTFESLGKPLEGRQNIIITNQADPFGTELWAVNSMTHAIDLSKPLETFVIGGQQIYDEIFKTPELIHRVYLTRVHCKVDGDTFFHYPSYYTVKDGTIVYLNSGIYHNWELIEQRLVPKSEGIDEYDSTFQIWENILKE